MGSPTLTITPHKTMAEEKKTTKSIFAKPLKALNAIGNALQKKKTKQKDVIEKKPIETKTKVDNSVDKLIENLNSLNVSKKEIEETKKSQNGDESDEELKQFSIKTVKDDELNKFSFKTVTVECKEEKKTERTDSHSSQDSGFSEKDTTDEDDRVLVSLKELKLEDDIKKEDEDEKQKSKEKKEKKLQTVYLTRQPVRNKSDHTALVRPYALQTPENRQIHINKQNLSGGNVIVNFNASRTDNYTEVDVALKRAQQNLPTFTANTQDDYWDLVQELIDEESSPKTTDTLENPEDILEEFIKSSDLNNFEIIQEFVANGITEVVEKSNPIEEFHNPNYEQFDALELTSIPNLDDEYFIKNDKGYAHVFPTPPRSENVPSPMSDSQTSFYPSNSEYTLSPELSSPIHSDYEKYQEIPPYEDQLPSCLSDFPETPEKDDTKDKKPRDRNSSTSSMTMKQYKDLQKELALEFSKKECCQKTRKPCKDIFLEHFKKLPVEERKGLCVKVSRMDLKSACGVLHHILLSLSQSSEHEDLHLVLFCLICDRVLGQKAALFAEDFGLSLLKAATFRCPSRPLLTRYLVQCVRTALRADPTLSAGKEYLYREIDGQGDHLVTALARAGDMYADALSELLRRAPQDLPLFSVHHGNAEGYSALHVACRQHSAATPCVHVIHVLLEHADADLWKGDVKGDDTAIHLAVNSPTCDLKLVLVMFKHVDRKLWKKLAHVPNRSSVTPLEYARSATKSTTRQNYPPEVLEFLKKCR